MQLNNQAGNELYRVPLIGTEFSRIIGLQGGTSASSGYVGVGVIGVMIIGATIASVKDQRFVNAIPEKVTNAFTGKQTFYLTKRPGFQVKSKPASTPGTSVHVWQGHAAGTEVITAFGGTNSTVYNETSSIGTTTGVVNTITDTLVGTTPTLVMTTRGNKAYWYQPSGSITEITGSGFINGAGFTITGRPAFLDGYTFLMDTTGQVWNSDLNSISSWNGNFIQANMKPDAGIGVARYKDQIVALGISSIEFFEDAGNPVGSPLQRTPQGYINIGVVNQNAYVEIEDTIAFIGTTEQSTIGLYMLDGLQAKRFSTPTIESLLSMSNPTSFWLNAIKLVGRTFIVIVSTSDARTYVYGVEDGVWHEWAGTAILWQHMHGIAAGVKNIYAVTELDSTGNVYEISPTNFVFQDNSQNYTMLVQTSKVDLDNQKRKFMSKLRVIGDEQSATTPINVSWSDDDYQTYHSVRTVDMMNADAYVPALGSFRRRAFQLTNTNNGPCRLEALEFEIQQGYT